MRVVFAADHAGAAFKQELIERLAARLADEPELELIDLGGDGSDPHDDYPDFAWVVGQALQGGHADRAILVCGSGVGASVAANKMRGIRAGLCHDTYSAHQGVEHDDMNVLALGARVIGIEPATECALAFIAARFSGEPRHQRRVNKVLSIEGDSMGPRPAPAARDPMSEPERDPVGESDDESDDEPADESPGGEPVGEPADESPGEPIGEP
jgi:ribose 5-phosphate isomerase B